MGLQASYQHELDLDRHAGNSAPDQSVPRPTLGSELELDAAVIEALPIPGTKMIAARKYGMSLWGQTARIDTILPNGAPKTYFLKTTGQEESGRTMAEGEFESLKALHAVSPELVPLPYAWGKLGSSSQSGSDTYFLLAEFREVGEQPPNPVRFTARIAELHKKSVSPTGKFGFHITTCHAKLPQFTDSWEDSWAVLYRKQLEKMVRMDREKNTDWPEFSRICDLILDNVIPRLLEPLQSNGRIIKPCLLHGDLWDENTATDMDTGEPFIFDASSFYGHNEYDIGNWRAARHRLSDKVYVRNYKRNFPASEPEDEWDDRNLLYSLRFDLGAAVLYPGSNMRQIVKENMTVLCERFCPKELRIAQGQENRPGLRDDVDDDMDDDEEEEEEEEE